MRQKSIKNIRKEFAKHGIFYTPPDLAEKLKSYVDIEPESVYDPTCGSGALLKVFPDNAKKYGQELDGEQLGLININNFKGYVGDTLTDDGFAGMEFDCIIANPPFSVKWNPEQLREDVRFKDCPALPPPSKADWAFMLHILHHLAEDGIAVVLGFPGILYRRNKEAIVRKYFIENNFIERVVQVPGNTFEDTAISTCILVLRKNKNTTDIIFEDEKHQATVPQAVVAENDYVLSVNSYIENETPNEVIDIDSVNRTVVLDLLKKVENTFVLLVSLQQNFKENFYIDELRQGLEDILKKYQKIEKNVDKGNPCDRLH